MKAKRGRAPNPEVPSLPASRFPLPAGSRFPIPDNWPRGAGYSHAVSAEGRLVFIAGQIGWEPVSQTLVTGGLIAQTRQGLSDNVRGVRGGGAAPAAIFRLPS